MKEKYYNISGYVKDILGEYITYYDRYEMPGIYNGVKIDSDVDNVDSSKDLLLDHVMKKYNISDDDLKNIDLVKSKIRESNINEIIND